MASLINNTNRALAWGMTYETTIWDIGGVADTAGGFLDMI
jgi:hypothetical protein